MLFAMGTGILMSFTLLIVMARLGLRKFMGYPAILDAAVVLLLGWLLHGTFGGIAAAITGGLFFSVMITVIRKYYGYSRFTYKGWKIQSRGVFNETTYKHYNNLDWKEKCHISKLKQLKPLLLCIAVLLILLSVV